MTSTAQDPGPGQGPGPLARLAAGFRGLPDGLRVTTYVAAGLAVALVAASVLVVVLVRRPLPQTEGRQELPGLGARVDVVRDEHGIPQIYGDSVADLARAQGYVTAQERFFQMDVRRRGASGRLAELLGPDAVAADVVARTMGFRRVAEAELGRLEPDTRAWLEAYADGVNAYLDRTGPTELAVEYTVLGLGGAPTQPEDWTALDSLTWLEAMAWDLSGGVDDEVDRVLAGAAVGSDRAGELWPATPEETRPVVERGAVVDDQYEPAATEGGTRNPRRPAWTAAQRGRLAQARDGLAALPAWMGRGSAVGSNAVAVSGDHTASGLPLLAADPHLGSEIPGTWMQVGLHCRTLSEACPMDVAGFSLPGVPGVVVGHNDHVGWAMANLGADVTDLVVERVVERTDDDRYRYDGRWRPVRAREPETIEVAGGDDVPLTVRSTRHGPLLSDALDQLDQVASTAPVSRAVAPDEDAQVAVQWSGSRPSGTADAILGLDLATDWDSFRSAAADLGLPTQQLVYVDTEGHVATQSAGAVPVRKSGNDGALPVAGWLPQDDWTGQSLPAAALPFDLDPPDGVVVAANQPPVGSSYPFELGEEWDPGYRAQRWHRLLDDASGLGVDDLTAAQLDTSDPLAALLVPFLLDVDLPEGYADDGQALLEASSLDQPADGTGSAAAAYLNATWRALLARTFHDELPESVWPDGGPRWVAVVARLLERPDDPWWDDTATPEVETRDDVLAAAMLEARDELTRLQARDAADWTWGHQHRLELTSPALDVGGSTASLARRLVDRSGWQVGGGTVALDATAWDARTGYAVTSAPSMRMVLDPSDWDASRWISLTGVSGHPTSPHYTDQTDLWADGETLPFRFSEAAVADAAEDTLVLEPVS